MSDKDSDTRKRLKNVTRSLPYDCWGIIALFLGGYSEFRILILSVPGLYEYVNNVNSFCARNLVFKLSDFPKRGRKLKYVKDVVVGEKKDITENFSSSKILETRYQARITDRIKNSTKTNLLNQMVTFFPELQNLQIFCRHFNTRDKTIIDFGKKFPQDTKFPLRKLRIGHNRDFTLNGYFDHFPRLDSISLDQGTTSWKTICVEFFVYGKSDQTLRKLEEIRVTQIELIMNPLYVDILIKNSLKHLHIEECPSTPFVEIVDYPFLESLSIIYMWKKGNIRKISNLRKLRNFSIKSSSRWFYPSDNETFSVDYPTILGNLEVLYLESVKFEQKYLSYINFEKIEEIVIKRVDFTDSPLTIEIDFRSSSSSSSLNHKPSNLKTLHLEQVQKFFSLKNLTYVENLTLFSFTTLELEHLKSTLKTLAVDSFISIPPNLHETGPFEKGKVIISGFRKLEIFTFHTGFNVVEIVVEKCAELQRISLKFGYSDTIEKVKISDLQKLKRVEIHSSASSRRDTSFFKIRNCKKIRELSLSGCSTFPKDVVKKNLTVLEIINCRKSLLPKQRISGNVFKKLKYLLIEQNANFTPRFSKQKNLEKRRKVCVRSLQNLRLLWKLEVHAYDSYIHDSGIDEITGLSEQVDVVLKYKKGILMEEDVVKTMDKKRFEKFFNEMMRVGDLN